MLISVPPSAIHRLHRADLRQSAVDIWACPESAGSQDDVFNGLVEWQFSDNCSEAHNVATGELVAERIYPSSWRSVMATPTTVLEYSHSKLSLFKMSDFAHPVWSERAGPTTPLAMSSGHALVEAPAGGYWSVQPPPEGPQQRLAGNAEQFVTEEASLV
jgi:hypothetical protein